MSMVAAVAVLPRSGVRLRLRAGLPAGLAISMAVFAGSRGVLWMVSVPLLWVVLAGSDDLAMERLRVRSPGDPETVALRSLWPAIWRITAGAVLSMLLVAIARRVV
ncbi:MAG: hypothetical protein IPK00_06760 [Deltaproteobacteria bacterium]|nr:hypothetical protein [Deltaproteobacteria bacterium]